MLTKSVSRPNAKALILLAFAMGGCVTFKKPPPAATEAPVCAPEFMAECDTTEPLTTRSGAETSADYAMDLAKARKAQLFECAALNAAKAACLRPPEAKRGEPP